MVKGKMENVKGLNLLHFTFHLLHFTSILLMSEVWSLISYPLRGVAVFFFL
jgi:hypothetical protein